MPKKSDVFEPKTRHFPNFLPHFLVFFRIFRRILLISAHINITKLTTQDGRTSKKQPKSALEATRCLVKIFEGPQALWQGSERLETGDSGWSVQYFPPRPAEPPLPSACGGAYPVTGILSGTATLVLAAGSVEVVAQGEDQAVVVLGKGLVDAVAAVIDIDIVAEFAEHVLPREAKGEGIVLEE